MSKPVIALPYFPGSNGDIDATNRIKEYGMEVLPLYFHIGDKRRLDENARILANEVDGAVMCGGFPYEDRLGFGIVPSKIPQYADAMRTLVDSGKPVIAFCSGNQIAQAMGLAFDAGSPHKVRLLPNICDSYGELVWSGFYDQEIHTALACQPERTAFTRLFKPGEVMPDIIDHGGGRFWADQATIEYLLENGMVVTRYSDKKGKTDDNFPINPNGSMLNIESITNKRGNLKIGMCHNERKLNALLEGRANLVFASMREYIEDGCPGLSDNVVAQNIPIELKDFSYISETMNTARTVDIYVKMLTDDNERTAAQLFLGEGTDIDRRRLLRLELACDVTDESMKRVLVEIAGLDFLDGIMLKKDLPTVTSNDQPILTYEVVDKKEGGVLVRDFNEVDAVVEGFPHTHEQVSMPNPNGYFVREKLWANEFLRDTVTKVHAGTVWFFPDEKSKETALTSLLD